MDINEIRSKYLNFYKNRGHAVIPSAPLVPQNDPTTLFTGSGMQPLVPYLLGKNHSEGNKLTDSQKSFRSMDIEEVGDNRHTTFFEMLGNWSLGDYFKKEQLPWFFEFLTKDIGLDPAKLFVTVFMGDPKNNVPRDTESAEIWKNMFAWKKIDAKIVEIGSEEEGYKKGMQDGRIFYYDAKKNWWSRAGVPENMPAGEPGGPDSEMFYDFGTPHDKKFGENCHPNCDCGRFMEIGNSVFMQYIKREDGSFALLPKQNVDFGGGLERMTAAKNGDSDVFLINAFDNARAALEAETGKFYKEHLKDFRIVLDHIRASVFLIGDGVTPSNNERGYVLRRLLRRATRFADNLGARQGNETVRSALSTVAEAFIKEYQTAYPNLAVDANHIFDEIEKEEKQFRKTLSRGIREFERLAKDGSISGEDAFQLVTTYGFPIELIKEEAIERSIKTVDIEGFEKLNKAHRELSRAGSEQKFKGGLADTSEKTTRLHTAHHLLLKALQVVLGPEVKQRGSNITQERLRIDFLHTEKMTDEQKKNAERIVNEKIQESLPVIHSELEKTEAEKLGAEHEFGQKYPDRVSVYSVGPKEATQENPHYEKAYSLEFCGGPHVQNTSELGHFKILKEEAVAQGIRRIKAVLE